ncbi:MAG: hypothetical protein IJS01_05000 [Lentisphaeria bacterium]|nr:hypothetical protein [Lentisphaeria bacterium]
MKRRFCFTLVEILVVTALVALLGAIGFAGYGYAMGAARRSATESLIKQIEAALENFKIKKGYYPSSSGYATIGMTLNNSQIVSITFGSTTWNATGTGEAEFKTFLKPLDQEKLKKNIENSTLVDSWGGAIRYRYPGAVNTTGFDLIAPGPDGQFGVSPAATPADPPTATTYKSGTDWACDDIANFMNK